MPLSEKHFYSIQNSLQDHAFIILDAKGCIVDASDSVATLTAYSADELLRQPLSIFLPDAALPTFLPEHARDCWLEHLQRNQHLKAEGWLRRKDQQHVWAEVTLTQLHDPDHPGFSCIIKDSNERKQAELESARAGVLLDLLRNTAVAANQAPSSTAALSFAVTLICETTGWQAGHVLLKDADDGLYATDIWHVQDASLGALRTVSSNLTFTPGQGVPGMVLTNHQAVWLQSVSEDVEPERAPVLRSLNVTSSYALPIRVQDKTEAVLEFFSDDVVVDTPLQDTLTQVAEQLGRVFEREHAELRLQQSEQRYRLLAENVTDVIIRSEPHGVIRYASPAAKNMFGLSPDELTGHMAESFIHPEDLAASKRILKSLATIPDSFRFEFRFKHKTRQYLWTEATIRFIKESRDKNARITELVATFRDISTRKVQELALKESEARFRAIFNSSFQLVWLLKPDGTVLEANKTALDFAQVQLEDSVGLSFWQGSGWSLSPAQQAELKTCVLRAAKGSVERYELELGENSIQTVIDFSFKPTYDDAGNIDLVIAEGRDITERRLAEAERDTSHKRFMAVYNALPDAIICVDNDARILECNPAMHSLFGYDEQELIGRRVWVLCSPELSTKVMNAAKRPVKNTIQAQELPFRHKNGDEFIALTTVTVLEDHNGQALGHMWMIQDVSAQKQAEAELAQTYQRLVESREQERMRLARELHDGVVQDLLGVSFKLAAAKRALANASDSIQTLGKDIKQDVLTAVKQLRGVISDLRPAGLEEFGLTSAIEGYVANIERKSGKHAPRIKLELACDDTLPSVVATCLFRATQEGIQNALKHSKANLISVTIRPVNHEVLLTIEDDGIGFSVPENFKAFTKEQHFGLAGLAERVELVNGMFMVHSQPNVGTEISITIPLDGHDEHTPHA